MSKSSPASSPAGAGKKTDSHVSAEQLDHLLRITTPGGWVALSAMAVFMAAVVIWGFWGIIPQKVAGQGILMRRGGLYTITGKTGGIVDNLLYQVGDQVAEGEVVAIIRQQSLADELKSATEELHELELKLDQTRESAAEYLRLDDLALERREADIELDNQAFNSQIKAQQAKLKDQEMLFQHGLVTKQNLFDTQAKIDGLQSKLRANHNELKRLRLNNLQLKNDNRLKLQAINQEIADRRTKITELENSRRLYSQVVSPFAGRVVEVLQQPDHAVSDGAELMTLELDDRHDGGLEAVIYAPGGLGKKIKPGMKAHVNPGNVEKDKYGSILGIVTFASAFPSSSAEMENVLQNDELVKSLTKDGSPLEIRVTLLPDPDTVSGFAWTSSGGPDSRISAGSLCKASVVVEQSSPFRLIVPKLKKAVFEADEG